ncbi:MAG: IclR family transcriptional regulator [Betaproteobacteria bacterium]|nr:IclR family transcriptional regulator [Betaproteobacteria bacterium]
MSSLGSSLAILSLFGPDRPTLSAEAITESLGFTRPTTYRYLRELVASGLLVRLAPGTYALGPRIIELDWQIRRSDPLLRAGLSVIPDLSSATGFEVNLVGRYGDHIVTTHQQHGLERLPLSFGRGRPLPPFRGAGSKIIVAHFPRARLRKLYDTHRADARDAKLGSHWEEVRLALAAIRRQGFAVSHGELDPGYVGVAAPVFAADGDILGSVIAALPRERLAVTDLERLTGRIRAAGQAISLRLAEFGDAPNHHEGVTSIARSPARKSA